MGRPRGGGGRSHGGSFRSSSRSSSSRSHSSFRSSSSSRSSGSSFGGSSRSSFGSSYGSSYGSRGNRYTYRTSMGPSYPRNTRRTHYYGGVHPTLHRQEPVARQRGCLTSILSYVILILILILFVDVLSSNFTKTGYIKPIETKTSRTYANNSIDENLVFQAANQYYNQSIGNENSVLLYYTYLSETQGDSAVLIVGDNAFEIFDEDMQDKFWEIYDYYYYSDVSEGAWIGNSFADVAVYMEDKIDGNGTFISNTFEDNLSWITTSDRDALNVGLRTFYKRTGIQPYVVLLDYEDVPGAKVKTDRALAAFIASVGAIVIVVIGYNWWKKKKQEDREKDERTERILNTPLDTFGEVELSDLEKKYSDQTAKAKEDKENLNGQSLTRL